MDAQSRRILDGCLGEVSLTYSRASGPGGQNVNKVATAVQLRFDMKHSAFLDASTKQRFAQISGKRLTNQGVLVIEAARFRTQSQNRKDALLRFEHAVLKALQPPRTRRPTKRTTSSREQRLRDKRHRSELKGARRSARVD